MDTTRNNSLQEDIEELSTAYATLSSIMQKSRQDQKKEILDRVKELEAEKIEGIMQTIHSL